MLLQAILALVPALAFQIRYDRSDSWKEVSLLLAALCGGAMALCMLTSYVVDGYELNLGLSPYILGSLYGGLPAMAMLTVLYIGLRAICMDASWELAGFLLFLMIFVPLLVLTIRPFRLAKRHDRMKMAWMLAGVLYVCHVVLYVVTVRASNMPLDFGCLLQVFAFSTVGLAVQWASFFIVESVKEKQQLHEQLQHMSGNFRNEAQKLQQFIDETSLGVVIVDREGRITHINEMAMQLFHKNVNGRSRLELIGLSFPRLSEGIDKESQELLYGALKGKQATSHLSKTDAKTYVKTSFSIRDLQSGAITGAALIFYDVTELNWLRDELGRMERLSLVGQMAASITHEIRNPMAVIRGFVQLMRERSPDHLQEYFRIVLDELDRANSIINDFLSLAQNRMIEKERCSLNSIILELLPLLMADANMRGLKIELDLEEDLPELELNEKEIKQLILNLVRNGMEAMEDKGEIRIATFAIEDAVVLQVTDEGIGIPEEKIERLFEPFFTTKERGTGLGLPLCLSIVERHNGVIEVESREGEGTTFTVKLALEPPPA